MKMFVVLASVLLFCAVTAVKSDCASEATACLTKYEADAISFRTEAQICGGAQTYLTCYRAACGPVPQSVVDTMEDKLRTLAGHVCDLHA